MGFTNDMNERNPRSLGDNPVIVCFCDSLRNRAYVRDWEDVMTNEGEIVFIEMLLFSNYKVL